MDKTFRVPQHCLCSESRPAVRNLLLWGHVQLFGALMEIIFRFSSSLEQVHFSKSCEENYFNRTILSEIPKRMEHFPHLNQVVEAKIQSAVEIYIPKTLLQVIGIRCSLKNDILTRSNNLFFLKT